MIVAGLILTAVFGFLLVPASLAAGLLARLGLGFGAGAFLISLQMLAYDLVGASWSAATLMLPWVLLSLYLSYRRGGDLTSISWDFRPWGATLLLALLAIPVVLWLPYERLMPLTSQTWDAWAIWLLKAKAFYLDGGISGLFERIGEFKTQPGYPLLTPLYCAFLYVLEGAVDDQSVKLVSPAFLFASWGVVYGFARRYASAWAAACLAVMLGLAPMVNLVAFDLAGYADTALSFYTLAAAGFLHVWFREQTLSHLAGASLAATAAAWTKNEGQLLLAAVVGLAILELIRRRRFGIEWAWVVAPSAIVVGGWSLIRSSYSLEAAGFAPGMNFQLDLFQTALSTMLAKAFSLGAFNLTFVLLVAGCGLALWLRPHPAYWVLPLLAFGQFGGALLAYATGRNEIQWWLETSGDRILAQIAPLAILSLAPLAEKLEARFPGKAASPAGSKPAAPVDRKSLKKQRRR